MPITIETIPFAGWKQALSIKNAAAELVVTLEVGPRILSYAPAGGHSVFKLFEDQAGKSGEDVWRSRGGHRLWAAPESMELTYAADNHPVAWEQLAPGTVRFTPPPEAKQQLQKSITVTLHDSTSQVRVEHHITNLASQPIRLAPWALSVMRPGGIAVIPQPEPGEHPRDLLPNRKLVLWSYTDLSDPRLFLGRKFITLRQDAHRGPTKFGLAHAAGVVGYWVEGTLFVKQFAFQTDAEYPDFGCNFETFTNQEMLEVETLGPLVTLGPGQTTEHVEEWELRPAIPAFDPRDESSIPAL